MAASFASPRSIIPKSQRHHRPNSGLRKLLFHPLAGILIGFLLVTWLVSFVLVLNHPGDSPVSEDRLHQFVQGLRRRRHPLAAAKQQPKKPKDETEHRHRQPPKREKHQKDDKEHQKPEQETPKQEQPHETASEAKDAPRVRVETLSKPEGASVPVTRDHHYRSDVTLYIEEKDGKRTPSGWTTRISDGAEREEPYAFRPGVGLIEGWTEGVLKMHEGERALVHVPAALGYGKKSVGAVGGAFFVPPNADLVFDIKVLGKEDGDEHEDKVQNEDKAEEERTENPGENPQKKNTNKQATAKDKANDPKVVAIQQQQQQQKPKPKNRLPTDPKDDPKEKKKHQPDLTYDVYDDDESHLDDDHEKREYHFQKAILDPNENFAAFEPELTPRYESVPPFDTSLETPHVLPKIPLLPPFAPIDNGTKLIDDLLHHNKPTIAGVVALFNEYLEDLHATNKRVSEENSRANKVHGGKDDMDERDFINAIFDLHKKHLDPLDDAYRGRTIFPVREDGSVFVSLAAFREHLLAPTLRSAFEKAKHPDKLFVGVVVQNCFGLDSEVCRTGKQVVGKYANGRDKASIRPAPPDANGVEEFCTDPSYQKYCDSGQVRVLYVHDTDALGPQTARHYASKLWGGETFFLQMDSHLEFAPGWDQYYIDENKAAKNYPKSVLSAYPPGFEKYDEGFQGGTPGDRLCAAHFSKSDVEWDILRIEQYGRGINNDHPTQIPFIAAGFFFAHASFLRDVPFDPYAPYCFMGEEIALSVRAWTSGWDIYAPRKNMIAHQYRPGRWGLPKFWESVGRDSGRGSLNTRLQRRTLRRIKHMVGYPTESTENMEATGDGVALYNFRHYSLGHERTLEAYLRWTKINPSKLITGKMDWCINAELA